MEFFHKKKDGEMVKLPVRVVKGAAHQDVYSNSSIGGPVANYHFRIDFCQDQFPPREYMVLEQKIEDESITDIERTVLTSVYLSMPALKELRNWLDKHVVRIEEQYGEIVLPRSDEDADAFKKAESLAELNPPLPAAKEA
jgi:hypothetical protein